MPAEVAANAAVLTGLGLAFVLTAALSNKVAQDWLPFRVAAALAPPASWSDIYPDATISSLFSLPSTFRLAARAQTMPDGPLAVPENALTAFVSPPPAAFLLRPLTPVSGMTALTLSRLALALPVAAALIGFGLLAFDEVTAQRRWIAIAIAATPLVSYIVDIGQPSAWLFPVVVASLVPALWLDILGGIALGLLIVTKGSPVVIAIGLLLIGRRRLAVIGLGVAASAVAVTWSGTGTDAWSRFLTLADQLGRSVIPDWNNASIDADVSRWLTGEATNAVTILGLRAAIVAAALKAVGVAGVLWSAWRSSNRIMHVSAVFVGWMLISPLVWLHYLIVLVPLIGAERRYRSYVVVACVASLSLPLVLRSFATETVTIGHLATATWLITTCLMMWPRPLTQLTTANAR